jgi:colicin import membrane protein
LLYGRIDFVWGGPSCESESAWLLEAREAEEAAAEVQESLVAAVDAATFELQQRLAAAQDAARTAAAEAASASADMHQQLSVAKADASAALADADAAREQVHAWNGQASDRPCIVRRTGACACPWCMDADTTKAPFSGAVSGKTRSLEPIGSVCVGAWRQAARAQAAFEEAQAAQAEAHARELAQREQQLADERRRAAAFEARAQELEAQLEAPPLTRERECSACRSASGLARHAARVRTSWSRPAGWPPQRLSRVRGAELAPACGLLAWCTTPAGC